MKKYSANILIVFFIISSFSLGNSLEAQTKNKEIFAKRRQILMEKMDGGLAVFKSEENNSDFYYLTGFDEPEAAFILIPDAKEKYILFVHPKSPARTVWTGELYGVDGAVKIFGADKAYPLDKFDQVLRRYLRGKSSVYCSFENRWLIEKLIPMLSYPFSNRPKQVIDPREYIHEMRLIKSPEEIELMRKAINITCDALIEAIKAVEPGMYEYDIEAIIEYVYRIQGSPKPGFPSIIGSGPNSTILHYEENNRKTQNGDLVLMDVGAEYGFYTADVTRTIPVNGKFSKKQREVYEVVLEAQEQAINFTAPGVGLYEIHNRGVEVIKEGLYRLGLITDKESNWQHRVWLMYNINHWLGLDVHDVGGRGLSDGKGRRLKPGMIFTVEPGIYIREDSLDFLSERLGRFAPGKEELTEFVNKVGPAVQKYANIGIRIEDDVLVTKDGFEVLSVKAPKSINEIEKLMKKKSYLNKDK